MSTPSSHLSSEDDRIRPVPGTGGGISVASLNSLSGSPFIYSPPPLPTPKTVQTITTSDQSTTPALASSHDSRTPMTVQLQRLLQATPATAAGTPAILTPRSSSTPGSVIVPATPSPYTIDQFLQQSGLPPKLSRTATNVVFTVLSWTLSIVNAIAAAIVYRFKSWWNTVISKKFPNTADIIEALLEYAVEVCQFLFKVGQFLSPYVVWLVQTLIATLLFIGGSFICGIIILCKGRDAAESSGAGEVQSSAMKSLNESIQNSPFYSRKAVPFTPRFAEASIGNQTAVGRVQNSTTFKSPPATTTIAPKPSSNKSTPPVSVMKRHSSFQSNPNTPNAAKPTPKTRRVLFSESEHGQVDTEQFFYDKTMPSARKLPRPNEDVQQMVIMPDETQATDTPNRPSPTNSPASTPVLRPSKFGTSGSTDNKIQQQSASQVAIVNQPSTAEKKQQAQQDEQSKQQYIEQYGLLPSITPLSKRYGRMKRQHGQSFAIANNTSRNITASVNNNGNNAKRKRRDLLGAASRMGRRRLNNHRTGGSSLPVVLLGKNRTPMKRRREDELNRTDEWVWRAMNSDGEKENLDSQDGGATKRTKFVNDTPAAPPGLSTPPKSTQKSFPAATTPPKTPGPSTFAFGSATPAPKSNKNSDIGATPGKTPLPSTFNDSSSSASGGFLFGNAADAADTPAAATKPEQKDGSGASFSFGSTPAQNETAAASFSFGGDASKSNDAKSPAPFSFGAPSSTPAKTNEKKESSTTPSVNTSATASTEQKDTGKSQTFSFGSTSTPAPANAQGTAEKPSFSFGSAGQINTPATSASTSNETKQIPSFSFGGANTGTPSSGFAFGSANQPPAAAPAAAGATPASTFSFGSTNQTPVATPVVGAAPSAPMFAFGSQTPGAGGASLPSSFSVGGSASGASARRRAAGRRK